MSVITFCAPLCARGDCRCDKRTGSKRDAAVRVGRVGEEGKIKDGYSSREAEANEKANEKGSSKRR